MASILAHRHAPPRRPHRDVAGWLRELRREAEMAAERHGPLRGPIRPAQRPWILALDVIEAEGLA